MRSLPRSKGRRSIELPRSKRLQALGDRRQIRRLCAGSDRPRLRRRARILVSSRRAKAQRTAQVSSADSQVIVDDYVSILLVELPQELIVTSFRRAELVLSVRPGAAKNGIKLYFSHLRCCCFFIFALIIPPLWPPSKVKK